MSCKEELPEEIRKKKHEQLEFLSKIKQERENKEINDKSKKSKIKEKKEKLKKEPKLSKFENRIIKKAQEDAIEIENDDFFFDTEEAANEAALKTQALKKDLINKIEPQQQNILDHAKKYGVMVPYDTFSSQPQKDDIIDESEFFGEDAKIVGRALDLNWEWQRKKIDSSKDKQYHFKFEPSNDLKPKSKKRSIDGKEKHKNFKQPKNNKPPKGGYRYHKDVSNKPQKKKRRSKKQNK